MHLSRALRPSRRRSPLAGLAVALAIASASARADGGPDAASAVQAMPPSQESGARPAAPERPLRLTLSTAAYTDSNGVYSAEPRLVASIPTVLGAELRLGGSYTAAGVQLAAAPRGAAGRGATTSAAPGRSMAGAALSVPWSIFRATAGYAEYLDSQGKLQDREVALAVKPFPALEVSAALRHRPFVEMAEPLATDQQPFYSAGPGGALDLALAWPLAVTERRLMANVAPAAWAYAYADARFMDVSDGNRGWNASVGAGASLGQLLGATGPVDVTARWDTWAAGYASASTVYYSPSSVWTHSPGVEVRLRRRAFELAGEGGVTFAPGQSFTGVFGGGSALLRMGRVSLVARAQARSDPWFSSRKAWVALQSDL